MILTRLGNKTKIAQKIQTYFPKHTIYIEPFFGAGGMFFNKPKAKQNIVNDIDSDVFNLFQVVSNKKTELEKAFLQMPIHSDLLAYWKKNKETDPIKKALRFLLLSNFTYLGKPDTLQLRPQNSQKVLHEKLQKTHELLFDVQFANYDFRKFLKSIGFRHLKDKNNVFIYCDPPYLNTANNYDNKFTETDSNDLFNSLEDFGSKWAMSEFEHPFILEQAAARNLNIYKIGERQNLKNRKTEILITNYKINNTLF